MAHHHACGARASRGRHPAGASKVTVSRALMSVLCGFAVAVACGAKSPVSPTVPAASKLAPAPDSPADGAAAGTFRPTLVVRNTSDQSGAKVYEFQISETSDFAKIVARQANIPEDASGMTSFTPEFDLQTAT